MARQVNPIIDAKHACQSFEFRPHIALRPRAANDDQLQRRMYRNEGGQTLNHTMKAPYAHTACLRDQHFGISRQPKLSSCIKARSRSEPRQIDAIADHLHTRRVCTELECKRLQGAGYSNELIGSSNCSPERRSDGSAA